MVEINSDVKISVGILIPDNEISAWINKSISDIAKNAHLKMSLVVIIPKNTQKIWPLVLRKVSINMIVAGIYRFIDRIYYKIPNYALKKTAFYNEFDETPVIINNNFSKETDSNLLINDAIRQNKIDMMISFLDHWIPDLFILREIRYGIWYFRHGNYDIKESLEIGLNELVNIDGELRSTLIISTHSQVIEATTTCSITHMFSQRITLDNHLWKCSYILPRILSDQNFINSLEDNNRNSVFQGNTFQDPLSMLKKQNSYFKIIGVMLKKGLDKFLHEEQWILLFGSKNWLETIQSPESIKKIIPPMDRFWADPFLICKNGFNYVFFEEYENKLKKGYISVLQVDNNGRLLEKEKVLERPYHLSYPYIFEYEGVHYMIPESTENKTIELYRCIDFPNKWEFVRDIMRNITAHDSSILIYNGKIWLFTCIKQKEIRWNYDDLHIFYNSELFSDNWMPHPENPVMSDVKRARPAGKFFIYENKLYRPSQNCSGTYGRAININCIDFLDESSYHERVEYEMDSRFDKRLTAIHTINSDNGITVMDGKLERKRKFLRHLFFGS
jgi:hypothetical protein